MNIFKLDPTTYLPTDAIKGFTSFIWAERYNEPGDFSIEVKNDLRVLTALPPGTLISHTDTLQIMMVEEHRIKRSSEDELTATVSGRSIDSFMEFRGTRYTLQPIINTFTGNDFSEFLDDKPELVAKYIIELCMIVGGVVMDATDMLPNTDILNTMRFSSSTTQLTLIPRGYVSDAVRPLLNYVNAGIKVHRPWSGHSTMRWYIHDGLDYTLANSESRDSATLVTFAAAYKDLLDAEYFLSNRDYRNFVHVAGKTAARAVSLNTLPSIPEGWARRTGVMETTALSGSTPTRFETVGFIPSNGFETVGQRYLRNHPLLKLLNATVAPTARPKYKIHYDIGDLVQVAGEFGISQAMRVTEHVVISDKEGVRGYPSLTVL